MTFKYTQVLPATGPNKIARFKEWAKAHAPGIDIHLPPQVPIEATALTIRLKSTEDRDAIKKAFPATLP